MTHAWAAFIRVFIFKIGRDQPARFTRTEGNERGTARTNARKSNCDFCTGGGTTLLVDGSKPGRCHPRERNTVDAKKNINFNCGESRSFLLQEYLRTLAFERTRDEPSHPFRWPWKNVGAHRRLLTRGFHRADARVPSTGWFESTRADLRSYRSFCSLASLRDTFVSSLCFPSLYSSPFPTLVAEKTIRYSRYFSSNLHASSHAWQFRNNFGNVVKTAACAVWM